jgi:micrococcal nuclease
MDNKLYFYKAKIVSVYDGDTCRADIDLGLKIWVHNEKLRLSRIDAPELRGAQRSAGLASRDFLRQMILEKEVFIQTFKDKEGKYGRYLVEIWLKNKQGTWDNINDLIVQNGHAQYKDY